MGDEALPAYNKAMKCLKNIDISQINELRTIAKPSDVAVYVFNCVLTLMGDKKPSWDVVKKKMQNSKEFLNSLLDFDKDNIPEAVLTRLAPMLTHENIKD